MKFLLNYIFLSFVKFFSFKIDHRIWKSEWNIEFEKDLGAKDRKEEGLFKIEFTKEGQRLNEVLNNNSIML
jgi:hypothetical protein